MPEESFGDLFTDLVSYDADLYRNIYGARTPRDLFDDLSPDARDWAYAAAAEARAKPPSTAPLLSRPFDYGLVITSPFAAESWHSTRYSDGSRFGVWYGSEKLRTTVFETAHHWIAFIEQTFAHERIEVRAERRVFRARCRGLLVDLRRKWRKFPALVDRRSYPFTHRVGTFLHDQGQNGLLARSARVEGVNAAIFRADVLSRVRDHCFLTYRWTIGSAEVTVERSPGRTWLRLPASV
jgi:hypothetical protein